jgi:hypothetical protein
MQILMFAVILGLILLLAGLCWRLSQLQQALRTLQSDQRQLASAWNALPPDARSLLPTTTALISIEILNPAALAARESRFAGVLGSVTPSLLRGIVYKRTADTLRTQLQEYGVEAEVKVHGLA